MVGSSGTVDFTKGDDVRTILDRYLDGLELPVRKGDFAANFATR